MTRGRERNKTQALSLPISQAHSNRAILSQLVELISIYMQSLTFGVEFGVNEKLSLRRIVF